jgi:hypothetical protein
LSIGLGDLLAFPAPCRIESRLQRGGMIFVGIEPIEARGAQQRNQLLRGIAGRGRKP